MRDGKRRREACVAAAAAVDALAQKDDALAKEHLDKALKILEGDHPHGMSYANLNRACEGFLKETGFPTLAVTAVYIENWQKKDRERDG